MMILKNTLQLMTFLILLWPFWGSAIGADTFDGKLSNAETSQALETLLKEYPEQANVIVPKLESSIIEEIKIQGAKKRFVIKEIVPAPGYLSGGVTMKGVGQKGVVRVTTEYPGDIVQMGVDVPGGGASMTIPWGNKSVHRFTGTVEIEGIKYTFVGEGDKDSRLSFGLIDKIGYVYLRGKGKVLQRDGTEVKLGY